MIKKVFVVGSSTHYISFIKNASLVDNIEDANIVLFTGGEDVSPELYGEKQHETTFCNRDRDLREKAVFESIKSNQFVIGVCRGSQFLCVMNGGKLIQNVNNHAIYGTHPIVGKFSNKQFEITSTHHQMQYPFNLNPEDYSILYVSDYNKSDYYEGGDYIDLDKIYEYGEPEIVLYHKKDAPRCLAIQGHPEMMRPNAPIIEELNNLIDAYLTTEALPKKKSRRVRKTVEDAKVEVPVEDAIEELRKLVERFPINNQKD